MESAPGPAVRRSNVLVAVILLVTVFAAIYEADRASREKERVQFLSDQVQRLQNELDQATRRLANSSTRHAPRLPAPPMHASAASTALPADSLQSTNLYARFKDKAPKLSTDQAESYLRAYGRSSSSLLAAFRTSGDTSFLNEAMQKYPDNPQVALEAAFSKDLSLEQRRQWLNAFAQGAPENPLANYLLARDYLKAGQTDQAVQELVAASGKRQFSDYTQSRRQDDEEAYLAAGYSTAEAKVVASSQVELPQLAELKQLGVQMVDLANLYRRAGDDASAQAVLQMAVNLGQSYSAGDCAISHLVGMAIQRLALGAMSPDSTYGEAGRTVQDQLDQLSRQKSELAALFKDNESLFERMSDQDWISYIDRDKNFGEEAARRWIISKYGNK